MQYTIQKNDLQEKKTNNEMLMLMLLEKKWLTKERMGKKTNNEMMILLGNDRVLSCALQSLLEWRQWHFTVNLGI